MAPYKGKKIADDKMYLKSIKAKLRVQQFAPLKNGVDLRWYIYWTNVLKKLKKIEEYKISRWYVK